ncbi:hypothetical protein BDV59DRAFT_185656 [Aspergillus ambiguus]|uniref:uncharacterized protein n=1 Tax=Aspergillus ambiguus TaxID=176160 RepID=UPI003CCD966E
MRSFGLLSIAYLLFLLGTTSAWPWSPSGLNRVHGGILERADTTAADSANTGASPTTGQTAAKTDAATDTQSANSGKQTGTQTGTATGKATKTGDSTTSSISVDPRMPAGGISMLTPSNGATTYFKVGQYVTFAWNYTSLSVTPSAVNVVASCSLNSATYTISSNMSVEETGKVVWDTAKYQANATVPLLTATYTLYVYDVDGKMGDTAEAGHLGSQIGYNFGMYLPQSYTPLNHYYCATCNAAFSDSERQALKFAIGMAAITITSFTWFAGGLGVFST